MQFRAARKVSEEVGAQIVLGDRPVEITVCTYYISCNTDKYNSLKEIY